MVIIEFRFGDVQYIVEIIKRGRKADIQFIDNNFEVEGSKLENKFVIMVILFGIYLYCRMCYEYLI